MKPLRILALSAVLATSAHVAAFGDAGPPDEIAAPVAAQTSDAAPSTPSGLPSTEAADPQGSPPKTQDKKPNPAELGSSVYSKIRSGEYLGALIPMLVLLVFLARLIPKLKTRKAGYILAQVASFGTYLLTWQASGEPWSWTLIPAAAVAAFAAAGGYDAFREKFGLGA